MLSSLRQTLRRLAHEVGFTTTVLLTLALGIGANVAIYAVVDAILVRPLPFPEAKRLVAVYNSYPKAGADHAGVSITNYYDRRHAIKAFASVSLIREDSKIVGEEGTPTRVPIARVTPEFFETLGVPLALGRAFVAEEMLHAADRVAILTDPYWRNHFDADPQIVGKMFLNDGVAITIVGVLPPGFDFLTSRAQFYRPASHAPDAITPRYRHSTNSQMIARLALGATLEQAQAQMDAFDAQQLQDDPLVEIARNAGYRTKVSPLHADHVREARPALILLQAAVLTLLLICGINLVNLLLIRANGRAKEFAVRQALGAGRRHLVREVMTETVLLALGGGVLGLLLGAFGIDLLARLGSDRLPLGRAITLDGRVAVVALLGSLLVGVLVALPVVFFNAYRRLAPKLQSESRTGTVGRAAQRVRHGFIVAQISLAFILLASAGLLGVSLQKTLATSPGFQPDHVLSGSVTMPYSAYPDETARWTFIDRLHTALRSQPGVAAVGFTSGLPFGGPADYRAIKVEGATLAPGESLRTHYTSFAVGEYWQALHIPLIEGRLLEIADQHREQLVCVVDAEFARRYWPGESALGHRIFNNVTLTEQNAITIVGVVGSVKQNDLADAKPLGAIYFPNPSNQISVVVRTSLPPEALASTLRQAVHAVDSSLPVDDIKPMQTRIDDSVVSRRSPAVLAGAFAVVALLLAAVGTYGVLAYAVSQRRREIGVRMALGALPQQVLSQFMKLGATLLAAGLVLGVAGAWTAGRAMQSMLFGVGAVDARVLAATTGTMIGVVLLATFIPSRRATKVDPMIALRAE